MDIKKAHALIQEHAKTSGGKLPTDAEMHAILTAAGIPKVPDDVLAKATPGAVESYGFYTVTDTAMGLARSLAAAMKRCKVCTEGGVQCAHCLADTLVMQKFAVEMAMLCQLVAQVALKTEGNGHDNPFERIG